MGANDAEISQNIKNNGSGSVQKKYYKAWEN